MFQLTSAASLNLGRSQNGVIGSELTQDFPVDLYILQVFADNQFVNAEMTVFVFDGVEILWEKEKLLKFSPYPTFISKVLFHEVRGSLVRY